MKGTKILLSFAMLFILLIFVKPQNILGSLSSMNYTLFVIAFVLVIPLMLSAFLRWKVILDNNNVRIPFIQSIKIYLIGVFLSFITPAKLGTLAKFYYLNRSYNVNRSTGLSLSIMEKAFDIIIVVSVSLLGIISMFGKSNPFFIIIWIAIIILIFSLFSRKVFVTLVSFLMRKLYFLKLFQMHSTDTLSAASNMYTPFNNIIVNRKFFAYTFILTVCYWFIFSLQIFFLCASLGINISIVNCIFAACLSSAIAFIPVTLGGIGTRDFTLVYIFMLVGSSYDISVVASLLVFLITQFVMIIFGWIFYSTYGDVHEKQAD